jgi:hypothetical protein
MSGTLKFIAGYWLIGCLFAGNVIGWAMRGCTQGVICRDAGIRCHLAGRSAADLLRLA